MGLGLLGRGLGDAVFLAECGADLTVTDLRDAKMLAPSLAKLKKYKNIKYTLGKHRLEDFRNCDFILKAAGVPLESPYIAEARKHGIPIEMDASLFAKLMPKGVTIVGVTGTRGKSTTTALIYEILNAGFKIYDLGFKNRNIKDKGLRIKDSLAVFRGGNLVPEATLPLLKEVKSGDIVVLELDSWQLQGFHDAKISPHIAVFTTFLDDHLIYYKNNKESYFEDKVAIFKYQKTGDILIAGERVAEDIGKSGVSVNGDFVVTAKVDVPADWTIPLLGEHNIENIACAVAVAKHFKIPKSVVQNAVENFKPIPGRLEFLREVRGVKIYNDNNATTPDATIAAIRALSFLNSSFPKGGARGGDGGGFKNPSTHQNAVLPLKKGESENHIILIMGGTDKGLDMSKLVAEIPRHCKAVIFLKESGTEKLLSEFPALNSPLIKGVPESARAGAVSPLIKGVPNSDGGRVVFIQKNTLKECVETAMKIAQRDDIILFSPAFASFGKWFKNEYDRGEQFVKIIDKIG